MGSRRVNAGYKPTAKNLEDTPIEYRVTFQGQVHLRSPSTNEERVVLGEQQWAQYSRAHAGMLFSCYPLLLLLSLPLASQDNEVTC